MIETPEDFAKLQRTAVQSVRDFVDLANAKYPQIRLAYPEVTFDSKGGVAGRAFLLKNKVSLNPNILFHNPERFLRRTTGHEVAHLVVFKLYGCSDRMGNRIKPHGSEWLSVMMTLGISDNSARHNYDMGLPKPKQETKANTDLGAITTFGGGRVIEFDWPDFLRK